MGYIDLRSDTVTLPTEEMMKEILAAELGDDVYGDDETVNRLETKAANIVGKEGALLVPTGTMGNLIAVMAHTMPGQEIILEESSHIFLYEVGGIARVAGVQARTLKGIDGLPAIDDIEAAIRQENIHFPETGLICIENTHNMAGGMAIKPERMNEIFALARSKDIPIHLDGARVFNAANYLRVDVKEITKHIDSIMFCLSKGLSAPVGSILAGTNEFIKRGRKYRKMLGGGMRQAGIIAAAGIVALDKMTERLDVDHQNAMFLALELNKLKGVSVEIDKVHTNIVNVDFYETGYKIPQLVNSMKDRGLLVNPRNSRLIRFVTHRGINKEDIYRTIEIIKDILK
ncbi:low-specificity L-threonine aldolase [Alkaliphilus peptidifermentans]|uniref:L-threonine aldolase n=1 Tax=Alkaliphilus peptidifermentans DSM 18978 TaxID=1120976 RepID=A0A1G5H0A2_9FIRM|nr:low-specificity L-threonine aldolase [Alkaliphilus peptidifermentans]SCY57282.1 L-threonine aldolase [Alkaliphilus peptidifermentans DSM 18978]